jgi:hypothetical protein
VCGVATRRPTAASHSPQPVVEAELVGAVDGPDVTWEQLRSGVALDDFDGSLNPGTQLEIWTDNGLPPQDWVLP